MATGSSKPSFVEAGMPIIDCDLHNRLPSLRMLYPYLPDYWCDYCEESGFPGPDANDYPEGVPTSTRPEITHPTENRPASDLALLRRHALDFWEVEYGILTCGFRVQSVHNEDLAAALASAVNDWQIEHWLDPEPRLRGSLIVPSQNPELAVREIERLGDIRGLYRSCYLLVHRHLTAIDATIRSTLQPCAMVSSSVSITVARRDCHRPLSGGPQPIWRSTWVCRRCFRHRC